MTNNIETNIVLPKGEWLDAIRQTFDDLKIPLELSLDRGYRLTFADSGDINKAILPIQFSLVRSREVGKRLKDPDSVSSSGFTGSDIVLEQGLSRLVAWDFTSVNRNMNPAPVLYLGSTPRLRDINPSPSTNDLNGANLYTTYPNIAREYCAGKGVNPKNIKSYEGGIEGMWIDDNSPVAIVDIGQSMETARANGIEVMDLLLSNITIQFIQISDKLTPTDRRNCDYLSELIWLRTRKISRSTYEN